MQKMVKIDNVYRYYDYNKPIIAEKDDFRSSVMRSHNYYNPPTIPVIQKKNKTDKCAFLKVDQPVLGYSSEHHSEYKTIYPLKQVTKFTRSKNNSQIQYNKIELEKIKSNPPNKINQFDTIYAADYKIKKPYLFEKLNYNNTINHPEKSKVVIYTNKEGYYKYLDPLASTTTMSYVLHTITQQCGIGKKDNITIWDWFEFPKSIKGYGLKEFPAKQKKVVEPTYDPVLFNKPMKDCIVRKVPDFVPNNGLKTEMQSNYTQPVQHNYEPDIHGFDLLTLNPTNLNTYTTEQKLYGSGKYLNEIIDSQKRQYIQKHAEYLPK